MTTNNYTETNAEVIEKALYCLQHGELESVENWLDLLRERLTTDKSRADALTDDKRQALGQALTEFFSALDRDIGTDAPDRILSLFDYHDSRNVDDLIDRAILPAITASPVDQHEAAPADVRAAEALDYDRVVSICDAHGIGLPVDCVEMVVEIVRHAAPPPPARASAPVRLTDAARDVLAERRRQVEREGWTPAHDDQYRDHELSCAAGCYAMHTLAYPAGDPPPAWPWAADWWKPTTHRRNLVKAGALIQAAIERLDRAGVSQ